VFVVSVTAANNPEPVYNLTVDNPVGEYFANGILVHNCDSARYACAYADGLGPFLVAPGAATSSTEYTG
jgi:hypothetical protein